MSGDHQSIIELVEVQYRVAKLIQSSKSHIFELVLFELVLFELPILLLSIFELLDFISELLPYNLIAYTFSNHTLYLLSLRDLLLLPLLHPVHTSV